MEISIILAKIFAVYLAIMGVSLLRNRAYYSKMIVEVAKAPMLILFISAIRTIMGLILISMHNVWVLGFPLIITLLGWLILVNGVVGMVFPQIIEAWAEKFDSVSKLRNIGIFVILLALALAYYAWL